jgi:uncharacterized protein (DUF58 family)
VSVQHGDRVGLLAFNDRVVRYVAPGSGRRQFLALTEALYDLEPESTETDYGEALEYLATRNRRRSLTVIFTDIAESEAASLLVTHLAHLARHHLPLVATLRDPAIEEIATRLPDDSIAVYQGAVARSLLADREQTLHRLRQHGVLTLDTSADRLSPSLINQYLKLKARTAL